MSNTVAQPSNLLDRIYDKADSAIARIRTTVTSDPTKSRRLLVVIGIVVALWVVGELILIPILTEVGDSAAWSEYNDKFKAASEKAIAPVEKSALLLLGSCMRRNQFVSTRTAKYLMLDRAEQVCLAQIIGQVMLSGGEEKAREVAATYQRMGFKIDENLNQALGL